jgi:hypothetical protein
MTGTGGRRPPPPSRVELTGIELHQGDFGKTQAERGLDLQLTEIVSLSPSLPVPPPLSLIPSPAAESWQPEGNRSRRANVSARTSSMEAGGGTRQARRRLPPVTDCGQPT